MTPGIQKSRQSTRLMIVVLTSLVLRKTASGGMKIAMMTRAILFMPCRIKLAGKTGNQENYESLSLK